jgi:hypothetical protein
MFTYFVATLFFFAAACTFHANGNQMSNASKEAAETHRTSNQIFKQYCFSIF